MGDVDAEEGGHHMHSHGVGAGQVVEEEFKGNHPVL